MAILFLSCSGGKHWVSLIPIYLTYSTSNSSINPVSNALKVYWESSYFSPLHCHHYLSPGLLQKLLKLFSCFYSCVPRQQPLGCSWNTKLYYVPPLLEFPQWFSIRVKDKVKRIMALCDQWPQDPFTFLTSSPTTSPLFTLSASDILVSSSSLA